MPITRAGLFPILSATPPIIGYFSGQLEKGILPYPLAKRGVSLQNDSVTPTHGCRPTANEDMNDKMRQEKERR